MSEEGRPTGRVDALLEELRSALADANGDEPAGKRSERLSTLADRAEELVATSETADLLEAVGLESDDEDPTGVARAIAEGDADAVRKLRSLLELAKYDEADPDARERLRETVDSAAAGATDDAEAGDGAETADGAEAADDAETESEADSEGGGAADETTEEQDTSGLARSLLDALAKNFDTGDDGEGDDDEGDDGEGDEGEGDDSEGDEGEGDDSEEGSGDEDGEDDAEEPDEDESEKPRDGTSRGRKGGGDGTRHSTVPRSKRADFFVPARHSTMPKRDG